VTEHVPTAVIGAGHAGLAVSRVLSEHGAAHVVLDRATVAGRWRDERWDSFTLLTPNWATWLPGWHYDGPDPHGFMNRDQVVDYLQGYARSFQAPVREGVEVRALHAAPGGGYRLDTGDGELHADSVVVATGPFQAPRLPEWSARLPADVVQVHSSGYRSPAGLPAGAVLVVGSGPSGQQIAEDLLRAGREVYVSVGRHRRVPRRYRGRDYYWWYELGGFYERTAEDLPPGSPRGDGVAPVLTGFGGGHDLDLRHLHAEGATLLGRAVGYDAGTVRFAAGLRETLAEGDRAYDDFVDWVESRLFRFDGLVDEPERREPFPDPPQPPTEVNLSAAGISAVVWATGFRPAYADWLRLPVLDEAGFPIHRRGVTAHRGLSFIGLPWLHRQRSAFIRGAEEDARYLAGRILADGGGTT
jgi:putative flavoprotein involved in K+ transport